MTDRVYLSVSYEERVEARNAGAKWDAEERKWYAPNGELALVQRWPVNNTPVVLTGENREYGGSRLFVDLIPSTCWATNVRKCVHPRDWDRLRRHVYNRVNNRCECCGSSERLEAHERWQYANQTQKLMRIVALCEMCHLATHIGYADIVGREADARAHLARVRNFNADETQAHIDEAFRLFRTRSQTTWNLDLSLITDNGIALATDIPDRETRRTISHLRFSCRE